MDDLFTTPSQCNTGATDRGEKKRGEKRGEKKRKRKLYRLAERT